MHIPSIPALLSLRFGVAVLFIAGGAASAQVPAQPSDGINESLAVSAPILPGGAPPSIPIPSVTSSSPSAPALTLREKVQLAVENYESVLEENRSRGNREGEAEDLVGLASAYRAIQQEHKAVNTFQSAIAIFHELGNRDGEATAMAHVGDVYREWGFPDTAVRFYQKALSEYSATSDKTGEAAVLNNSGAAWLTLRNQGKCLDSFRQAMALYQGNHDDRGEALALSNLGAAYLYFPDDPEKAIRTLEEAVAKMELLGDKADEANAQEMMGFAWLKAHRETTASLNFQHAKALYHALGDAQGEARVAGHVILPGQAGHSGMDAWSVSSEVSPEPLSLTPARLRVLEIHR